MLIYELKEKIGNRLIYKYYPEGDRNSFGLVSCADNSDWMVDKVAETDELKDYAIQAINYIDTTRNKGTVAWC